MTFFPVSFFFYFHKQPVPIFAVQYVFEKVLFAISRAVNEWCAIELARAHTRQYLFRCAIATRAKFYMTN